MQKLVLILLFSLLLDSCAQKSTSSSILEGSWQSQGCLDNSNMLATWNFIEQKRFTRHESYYSDSGCTELSFERFYEGRYDLAVDWQSDNFLLDIWVEKLEQKNTPPCPTDCPVSFQPEGYQKVRIRLPSDSLLELTRGFEPGIYLEENWTAKLVYLRQDRQTTIKE